MNPPKWTAAPIIPGRSEDQLLQGSLCFYEAMQRRRTIRDSSNRQWSSNAA
jgi:hypothetical protein